VILIGEIKESRRDTLTLQSCESGETLAINKSVVMSTMDDQGWRFPVGDIVGWRPSFIDQAMERLVRDTSKL
jgi:hypothetical protein